MQKKSSRYRRPLRMRLKFPFTGCVCAGEGIESSAMIGLRERAKKPGLWAVLEGSPGLVRLGFMGHAPG